MESESDSEPDDSSGFQDSGIGGNNTSVSQSASSDSGNADASSSASDVGPSSLDLLEVVTSGTFESNTHDTTRSSPAAEQHEAPSSDQMHSLQISQVGPSNSKKRTWDKMQSRVPQFLQHKKPREQWERERQREREERERERERERAERREERERWEEERKRWAEE
jgi:hypothetical protein